jgi:hypothetical protein
MEKDLNRVVDFKFLFRVVGTLNFPKFPLGRGKMWVPLTYSNQLVK